VLHSAKRCDFRLYDATGLLVTVSGWETSFTLGIYRPPGSNYYPPVHLMMGRVIADGFPTLEQCILFNHKLRAHPKVFLGSPFPEDLWRYAGGQENFFAIVRKCHDEASRGLP